MESISGLLLQQQQHKYMYLLSVVCLFIIVTSLIASVFLYVSFCLCAYFQSTPVGTTIFRHIHAVDKDAGVNGLVEYFVVEGEHTNATTVDDKLTSADGFGVFAISFPHQGQVMFRCVVPFFAITIAISVSE